MLNNVRLLLAVAAVGTLVTLAQGGTIVFNTDTGIVDSYSGGVIRTGDGTWTSSLDTENQIYTWAFTGAVTIPSGTTLQFIGSNRASFQAGEFVFGTEGGEAVTIDASSYLDGEGDLVRGAGGGLGGAGGHGGVQENMVDNGGHGGLHGEGDLPGSNGSLPASGANGSSGYSGTLGGIGAGSLAGNKQTYGEAGGGGAGGVVTVLFPVAKGGTPYDPPTIYPGMLGMDGYSGVKGDDGDDATMGSGGAFAPAGTGAAAMAAGNGGQGGGGGGSGGQGSGGGGGSGGSYNWTFAI